MGAPVVEWNSASMAAVVAGWWAAMYLPCRSPEGKIWKTLAAMPAITPTRTKMRPASRSRLASR